LRRLNLVIADTDENYLENLVTFLMADYCEVFSITSFTNRDHLIEFLKKSRADILLASPEIMPASVGKEMADIIISLQCAAVTQDIERYDSINKYQHGDKLVSSILRCLSDKNPANRQIRYGYGKTVVIGVYSPAGGVGKSAVAYVSSIICSQMGMKPFYLNMEGFHSVRCFSNTDTLQSFSNIIYHLKENDKNISLRIEAIKNIDSISGVHYFPAADSILDFDEIIPQDLQLLISQFKSMGKYDIVFIDMSSSFDSRNISLMNACDEVFLILTIDPACEMKAKSLFREAEILSREGKLNLFDKLTIIINKYCGGAPTEKTSLDIAGKRASIILPEIENPLSFTDINQLIYSNSEFVSCIKKLLIKYVKSDEDNVI